MLFIDTRIDAPPAEAFAEAKARGDELVHIPALRCEPTCVALRLAGCGAAFAASPRAAKIAAGALLQYKGAVWAVGKTTADVLRGSGIPVAREGSTGGAAAFFAGLRSGGIPVPGRIAWISATETAENRDGLSREYKCEIVHFPVYRTFPADISGEALESLPRPRTWLFYSGKGVAALRRYLAPEDRVELHGKSAARAGADILKASIMQL